jgi:AraC-like DNA-binding protein
VSAFFWFALLGQALAYIGLAMRAIHGYRRRLREAVSTLAGVDQSWLWWYSLALYFVYLAYALVPAILLHSGQPEAARHLAGGSLCAAVVILAAHQLLAKRGGVVALEAEPEARLSSPGPSASPLASPSVEAPPEPASPAVPAWDPELPAALVEAMEGRKLYRNPGLGLVELAEALGWPRNEVSAAINGHFGVSFHDFVNGFRVSEAKSLMLDPAKRGFTLVALAMDAGFNSKPTFNAVFKKTTGLAPTAWLAAQGQPEGGGHKVD